MPKNIGANHTVPAPSLSSQHPAHKKALPVPSPSENQPPCDAPRAPKSAAPPAGSGNKTAPERVPNSHRGSNPKRCCPLENMKKEVVKSIPFKTNKRKQTSSPRLSSSASPPPIGPRAARCNADISASNAPGKARASSSSCTASACRSRGGEMAMGQNPNRTPKWYHWF